MDDVVAQRRCQWRVRDHAGWREGVLINAAADLLVGWGTLLANLSLNDRGAAIGWLGRQMEQVRDARLCGDLDRIEAVCRVVAAQGPSPRVVQWPALGAVLASAVDALSDMDAAQTCLLGCHTCVGDAVEPEVSAPSPTCG